VSHVIRSDGDCRVRVLCALGKLEGVCWGVREREGGREGGRRGGGRDGRYKAHKMTMEIALLFLGNGAHCWGSEEVKEEEEEEKEKKRGGPGWGSTRRSGL
jgi:hypothetical protein